MGEIVLSPVVTNFATGRARRSWRSSKAGRGREDRGGIVSSPILPQDSLGRVGGHPRIGGEYSLWWSKEGFIVIQGWEGKRRLGWSCLVDNSATGCIGSTVLPAPPPPTPNPTRVL
jgi:hypothetical protein